MQWRLQAQSSLSINLTIFLLQCTRLTPLTLVKSTGCFSIHQIVTCILSGIRSLKVTLKWLEYFSPRVVGDRWERLGLMQGER